MPSNVALFLSILAGYGFIHLFYFTRFRAQRLDGHRLVIEAALVGVLLYAAAKVCQPFTPATLATLQRWTGNNTEAVDTIYILLLGLSSPVLLNLIIALALQGRAEWRPTEIDSPRAAWNHLMEPARRVALDWAISKLGNDLLVLLHEAVSRPRDRQMPLLLTLDNNKVYAGWVVRSPNLKLEDEYLSVLPLASGYRAEDTLKVTLNVFYPVHQYKATDGPLRPRDFTFVIPYASVKKAHYFDVGIYLKHFAAPTDDSHRHMASNTPVA